MTPPGTSSSQSRQNDRKVGVEIEFADLLPDMAAKVVADCLKGSTDQTDLYCWQVEGTDLGDFTVELDTRYVKKSNNAAQRALEETSEELGEDLRRLIGSMSENIVPTEIVGPPMPAGDLNMLDDLVTALRQAGAKDSSGNPLYAFGLHLNPDVRGEKVADILPTLQAYVLASVWLREEIGIDLARKALPYIDPFPRSYVLHITDPDYAPDQDQLIDDYLADNATRNRELDMLPLFAHLDESRVQDVVDDPRIKPRPTYHYRLPEARLSDSKWTIQQEWDRWCLIEALADDTEKLAELAQLYHDTLRWNWKEVCCTFMEDWRRKN
ncbi:MULTISPECIES: amidoligase family protein [Kordiimonas]|jgi:hypothetical protein|uniref:amidoligase family protein n=1 Tax=Kordiimonas TaxID=288021 RepID=UPI00257DC342|nr:amidoligase family protein [Kordiimonas sp. UBA4487]